MVTLLKEIQTRYSSFSDKERNLADYLLSMPIEASKSNIKDIAVKTDVSVATITRFCKKVSCRNFVEMKMKLAREAHQENSDSVDHYLKLQYEEMLHDIQGLSGKESLKKALQLLQGAKNIYIYGLGSSGLAAQELNYRLSRMGFASEAVTDPHLMIIRSALFRDGDLLLAFSRSGQTKDLLKSVSKAKSNGAKLVSFTAFGDTPLTNLSDAVLWTLHPVRTGYISTGLDLSALYLIDLISLFFLEDRERLKIYQETVSAISSEAHIKE
ncbi:MurR/RpiR family transcriptional regulator [Lederbergia citrea]|uniref:MurR/RpiR family transcriptional regulator n=1 Tax=Lederbergia citrea TaxID=2833581 RepID=A0A942UN70_9BACI|nr:MurR/RpiR family transcriptional regulator [Lederbergia citrea]MBS4179443.1 MurR/RpiR family transcriptional regulator [Lederbergia citrea]MBS4206111.1 MurR/RpiR family transcriptional regulator [Lederbergia citrea]MBS4224440.1 MurR/RpiR family transcriptional regulator [Lederbergia citrea]